MSRRPVRKNKNDNPGAITRGISRRQQRRSEPPRRACRLPQDLERGDVDQIAPSYPAQARTMKNIRLRFRIVWTPGWDAVDI